MADVTGSGKKLARFTAAKDRFPLPATAKNEKVGEKVGKWAKKWKNGRVSFFRQQFRSPQLLFPRCSYWFEYIGHLHLQLPTSL